MCECIYNSLLLYYYDHLLDNNQTNSDKSNSILPE